MRRRVQRSAEISEKRGKADLVVDKTPSSQSPPYIVVVQGPPKVSCCMSTGSQSNS